MKRLCLILMLLCIGMGGAFAQDLIVTTNNDSINCKIINETAKEYFLYCNLSGETQKARIQKDKVKDCQIAFYDTPIINMKAMQPSVPNQVVRFSIDGGWNFRLAKMSSGIYGDYREFLRKLTNGPQHGGEVKFLIQNALTLGLCHNHFRQYNTMDGYITVDGQNYYGTLNEKVTITFIGASGGLFAHVSKDNRHVLLLDYYLGYYGYVDEGDYFGETFKIEGKTVGYGMGLGYDFFLTKHFALGAKTTLMLGNVRNLKITEGGNISGVDLSASGAAESLRKLDFSLGIRYYL